MFSFMLTIMTELLFKKIVVYNNYSIISQHVLCKDSIHKISRL